jgi:hypothetical protein
VWGGVACGIAAGFAACASLVRFDVPFHYGTSDAQSDLIRQACFDTGRLWLACTLPAASIGAVLGFVLRPAVFACEGPLAATALYVLALRGAWGYHGPPRTSMSTSVVAALLASSALLAGVIWRRARAHTVRPGSAALHVSLSLTAMHLAVQLPYYLSLVPSFVSGLADLARIILTLR